MSDPSPRIPMQLLVLDIDGVLTDGTVAAGDASARRVHVRDLDALTRAREAGLEVAFLTGEPPDEVSRVVERCGGGTAVYNAKDKALALRGLAVDKGVPLEAVCYVGDARRDAAALEIAGLGLVPADAHPLAKAAAGVLSVGGGRGAVAEAVDTLLVRSTEAVAERVAGGLDAVRRGAASAVQLVTSFIEARIDEIGALAGLLGRTLQSGGRVLLFGNGGSAAMAQHAATELAGRFKAERGPHPAVALTADSALITAVANDYSFDEVFRRQIVALGRRGDIAVALSTSGRSPNVLNGLSAARDRGLTTVMLTGRNPDPRAAQGCDLCLRVPSGDTARVQEVHLIVWHLVCEFLDGTVARQVGWTEAAEVALGESAASDGGGQP